jgi:hypothetical protein
MPRRSGIVANGSTVRTMLCPTPRDPKPTTHPMFIHTVYFWMKLRTTDAARQQLIDDARAYLGKIPGVRHLWAGRPAMTPREVVDNSYDVGLTVVLDDSAAHDVYQVHDLHLEFIARNKPEWERVQIYDFNH